MKKCCTSNNSTLRYRLSSNSAWQVINLKNGTYCVDVNNNLGGWWEIAVATPPGAPFLCVPQLFKYCLNDFDPTTVYTNSGGTPATCPGNRGRTTTYKNGVFLRQPDDIVTIKHEFLESFCELIVTDSNNQQVFTKKINTVYPGNICPIEYTYICDSNCPDGFLECETDNYPGYCCIPCSEIKNEIKVIASQVRNITNG